jgi:hypothetical protein
MRTEDLIRTLAADTARTRPPEAILPGALALGAALAAVFLYSVADPRAELRAALATLPVLAKQALPALLALAAYGAVLRLARPGARLGAWKLVLALAPTLAALAFGLTAGALDPSDWAQAAAGHSRAICLTVIPILSLPILGASLWALRRGASTRPAVSGALAGLLAGGVAAAIYAFQCTDDNPMFWAIWYSAAIGIVTGLGALLGARLLRW